VPNLAPRPWLPSAAADRVSAVLAAVDGRRPAQVLAELDRLVAENRRLYERELINLNPATNVMNPRAEAMLSARLGSRASLGYPGEKYEMGLEAIEQIEVIAADLCADVFGARFAEVRVGSGSLANLYAFMATCRPGDTIVAPPPAIGGHVTHHEVGAAGLYGLRIVPAPVDAATYTIDVDALRELARVVRPKLITVGGSLNLVPHPVAAICDVAREVDAHVLFDAAHLCGLIAGGAWPSPLAEGADILTMSTYKSLGGPPGGLVMTNDAEIAQRLEAIAHPGLTANFDVGKTAALAVTMLDWKVAGQEYAAMMTRTAQRLAHELHARSIPVFGERFAFTQSHQMAVIAAPYGGGQHASRRLRESHLLTSGIGLPLAPVDGDLNGIRIGTPEIVRIGMTETDMPRLAGLVADTLSGIDVSREVAAWRSSFTGVRYTAAA